MGQARKIALCCVVLCYVSIDEEKEEKMGLIGESGNGVIERQESAKLRCCTEQSTGGLMRGRPATAWRQTRG